jgi:diamine N-acetyltransferase
MKNFPPVRLRAIEPEDLDLLYKIENDWQIWKVGITNVPYSRYVLHDYIAKSSSDIYTDRQVRLMIEDANTNMTVGIIDLVNFSPSHLRAEVGIAISPVYRRKGYASAAIAEIKNYSHLILHLHQLYVVIAEGNIASQRLFQSAGFQDVQLLKDWLRDGEHYCNAILMQTFL